LYQRDAAQYIQAVAALPTGPDVSPSALAGSLDSLASAATTFANVGNDMLGSSAFIDATDGLGTALRRVSGDASGAAGEAQRMSSDQQTVASDEQAIQWCGCQPGSLAYSDLPAAQHLQNDQETLASDERNLNTDLSAVGPDIKAVAAEAKHGSGRDRPRPGTGWTGCLVTRTLI
jgi:hypothetical protein